MTLEGERLQISAAAEPIRRGEIAPAPPP
jgi:hypothetical protein